MVVHQVSGPIVYHLSGNDFLVNTTIHYASSAASVFDLRVGWSTRKLRLAAPSTGGQTSSVTVLQNVTIADDDLWRVRNGKGFRARLFNVSICNVELGCFFSTRVGFRSIRLVTSSSTSGEGSGNFTLRLEVNSVPLILRGANWIPVIFFFFVFCVFA
jgi:hypothetical protein